jgi:RHS repeat-associated protein
VARSEAGNNIVYVHAGQQVIADYARGAAAAAPSFRYVYGSYVDEPLLRHAGTGTALPTSGTAALYYHRNQQYSIVGLSDAAGALVERYAYTAYGELTILAPNRTLRATSSFQNRYTYTGREWDAGLSLYYFRARWLEPKAGRFIGRDPLGYVDGMGLYSYLHSGPLGTLDPLGLFDIERWHPINRLMDLARDISVQIESYTNDATEQFRAYVLGLVESGSGNEDCQQHEVRYELPTKKIKLLGGDIKFYVTGRWKSCRVGCCLKRSFSGGFSARVEFPVPGLHVLETKTGVFGVVGGSFTGGYEWTSCDDGFKSESGFIAGRFYAGVRASLDFELDEYFGKWAKARAFVEAGAFVTGKWAFTSGKLEGSLGGYWRARAEYGFGPWSGTHQYGGSWCWVGNCSEGEGSGGSFD